MKQTISILTLLLASSQIFASTIKCSDPHTGVEVAIQLSATSDNLNFQFKIPKTELSIAGIDNDSEGDYQLQGSMGCIRSKDNALLIECFTEKSPTTLLGEGARPPKSFKSVVSFSLTEVTTKSANGTNSERIGSLHLFSGGLTLNDSLNIIHFGNLAGSGVEGNCTIL